MEFIPMLTFKNNDFGKKVETDRQSTGGWSLIFQFKEFFSLFIIMHIYPSAKLTLEKTRD